MERLDGCRVLFSLLMSLLWDFWRCMAALGKGEDVKKRDMLRIERESRAS